MVNLKEERPGFWLILVLSALGLYTVGTRIGTQETPKTGESQSQPTARIAAPASTAKSIESPYKCLRPVYDYWGEAAPKLCFGCDPFPNPDKEKGKGKTASYEFLIATVPDPVNSRMGYQFDSEIDAICAGVQVKSAYDFDRFWLPWPSPGARKGESEQDRSQAKSDDRIFERQPGVLLFRHVNSPNEMKDDGPRIKLMVVFLVGETPTAGIHKAAFKKCLELISCSSDFKNSDRTFRILGPAFSGSADSLKLAIQQWLSGAKAKRPAPTFRLISGSATSVDKCAFESGFEPPKSGQEKVVTFQATVLSDEYVMRKFVDYLTKERGCRGKIALLLESNTGYSHGLTKTKQDVTRIRFPLHIASLRPAYEADRAKRGETAANLDPYASQIHIPFEGDESSRDVVPSLDLGMTTAAVDHVVNQLMGSLVNEDFDAVGLFATDVRDKIFLANLVRKYRPRAILFTTDSNLLLASREHRSFLNGTICASSYPLYGRNQNWSFPFEGHTRRLTFSAASAYGARNAVLALLGKEGEMLEYGMPLTNRARDAEQRPALWFSVISQSGIWPVAVQPVSLPTDCLNGRSPNASDLDEYTFVRNLYPSTQLDPKRPVLTYSPVAVVFSLLVGIVSFVAVWRLPKYFEDDFAGGDNVLTLGEVKARRLFWGIWCWAAIPAVCVYFFFLWMVPLQDPNEPDLVHYWMSLGIAIWFATLFWFVLVSAVGLSNLNKRARGVFLRSFIGPPPPPSQVGTSRFKGLLLGLLCLPLGLICVLLSVMLLGARSPTQVLSFERAMHFESGLSPVVSVALLGALVFGWGRSQLRVTKQFSQFLTPAPFRKTSQPAAWDASQDLWDMILRPWSAKKPANLLIWAALVLTIAFVLWQSRQLTFENGVFTWAFWITFLLVVAVTLAKLLQVISVARRLFELTDRIGRFPLQDAFDRLPEKVTGQFARHYTARRPGLAAFQFPVWQWDCVASAPDAVGQLGLAQPLGDVFKADQDDSDHKAETPGVLAANAAHCIERLQAEYWPQLPLNAAFPRANAENRPKLDSPPNAPYWRPVEDFVAVYLVLYLRQFLIYLRHQVFILAVGPVLMLFAITIYRFEPHSLLLFLTDGLIVAAAAAALILVARINWNEIFSHISQTTASRLTLDRGFVTAVVAYALPLIVLVLTQFDEVSNWLFTWLRGF